MDALAAVLLVEVKQDFGVARGAEPVALGHERVLQLDVVEDLAVVGDPVALVGRGHRLLAMSDVDDAETRVSQADFAIDEGAAIIGSAMTERPDHPLDVVWADWLARQAKRSGNAAHVLTSPRGRGAY